MSQSTVLAKVKTILEGVADIGQVHDFVRWAKDFPDFFTLFKVTSPISQIRAWDISRTRTTEVAESSRTNVQTHTFRIRGFLSLVDSTATEKTFQKLVEDVATAFRNKPTLDGVALNVSPLQRDSVTHVMIGDVLCHIAELSLSVEEEVQWTE